MKPLTHSEQDGHILIQIPENLSQNDWIDLRDYAHRQFVDKGHVKLVFDCEQVLDLPSIAFGSFTGLSRDLRRINGSLHLIHVSENSRRVLTRIHLDSLIPVAGSLTEVIRTKGTATTPADRNKGPI